MAGDEWAFLVDENLEPQLCRLLQAENYRCEYVPDVLGKGAKDQSDVLPHAREHDLIVVTADVSDFDDLPPSAHEGIVLVYDQRLSSFEMVNALIDLVKAYPGRDSVRDRTEVLDRWYELNN